MRGFFDGTAMPQRRKGQSRNGVGISGDRWFESASLQQRVDELSVPERDIGHDLSEMGVTGRAELVLDDDWNMHEERYFCGVPWTGL
jgi:hypothetical protein